MQPAGPWATCALSLCLQEGPTRKLLGDGGCTPIKLECPFVNNVARCDVTGKVLQEFFVYDVTSLAVKADGVRKSTSGPQGTYTLPYFP